MKYQGSIKKRLTGIILLVATLTGVLGYSSFVYSYMEIEREKSLNLAHTVGVVFSQDIAKLILLNEVSVAADITSRLKSFPTLESMVLYKRDGEAVFQYSKNNKSFLADPLPKESLREAIESENILKLYVDATYQDTHLGFVQLKFRVDTLWDIFKRDAKMLLSVSFFMFILSYLLSIYYAREFTNPILTLVKFLEKIEFVGALKERIVTQENNEYGKLYSEVNTMLDRIERSAQEQQIAAVAFETQSGMTITDANQKILKINKAFSEITGYSSDEAIGKTPSILNSGMQSEEFYKNMHTSLKQQHYWSGEIHNRHKDGTIYPEYLTIQVVLDKNDEIIYYVASFVDLTTQKESEKKLQYLKQYDALTGLANREMLVQNIYKHLDTKKQNGWGTLLCLNLKDFKMINDAYGHESGDLLLIELTKRVQKECSSSDLICRIGADEFMIWFSFVDKVKDKASMQSKILAEELIIALAQPFIFDDKVINTSLYIGIAMYNRDSADADTLLKQANTALHHAKEKDQKLAFYDKDSQNLALEHLDIYSQLLVAIESNQFELFYQLQYNDNAQIYGAEALIRWMNPQKGLVSPFDFIPVAEKTGLILPIGLWVIQTACKQLSLWQENADTSSWILAINISVKQFVQDEFVSQIEEEIKKSKIKPEGLKLELTESILVDNLNDIIHKMKLLKGLGIQISLDDFGTGYSSLQYLKNLPINQLKIDQSFVQNMHTNRSDIAIIKSVFLLSEALNIEVVAEGVETKEHYELLKELGCKIFQGYYFARPQSIELLSDGLH